MTMAEKLRLWGRETDLARIRSMSDPPPTERQFWMTSVIDRYPDNISTQNEGHCELSVWNTRMSPETRRVSQRHHGYLLLDAEWTGTRCSR